MFKLVRFFLLTSAAAAIAFVIAFLIYRNGEEQRLIEFSEQKNIELAHSVAQIVWPEFSSFVMSTSAFELKTRSGIETTRSIAQALKPVVHGLSILKVKIYNLGGLTVFSSDLDEIGEKKADNPEFFLAASAGHPASKLTFRNSLSSFGKIVQERNFVESYIPIRQGEGQIEGVFELYTDVTHLMASKRRTTRIMFIGFLPIFGLLYSGLFLVVRRAEQTIKKQYADITEKNISLQEAYEKTEKQVVERTKNLADEIAERRRMHDQVQRHRDELAHVGRVSMIGEMATSLAHELNQPLSVISGYAQFCLSNLRSGTGTKEAILDAVEKSAEQAERATEIISRVRSFIHKEKPKIEHIDVNDVIRDIATILYMDGNAHSVDIEFDLANLELSVYADPIQLQQVVLNLVHNGIESMKDTQAQSRRVNIRSGAQMNGTIEVVVRDYGHGISPENKSHLFETFFTTKSQGLGLGLSISRSIIESHGGHLWAVTDHNIGAAFHFTLPKSRDADADDK